MEEEMKVVNTKKTPPSLPDPIDWTYDRMLGLWRRISPRPTRINCDIITFSDLLNDQKAIAHTNPVCSRAILQTGHYADIEFDGQWLEIHVDKAYGQHSLLFV